MRFRGIISRVDRSLFIDLGLVPGEERSKVTWYI